MITKQLQCALVLTFYTVTCHGSNTPIVNAYEPELRPFFTPTSPTEHIPQPLSILEKMFHNIFIYATQPYNQEIYHLPLARCPHLNTLVCTFSAQHDTPVPQIFIAQDSSTPHIDVKFCTFDATSAILIHPGTVTALSTKVFELYIEQVLVRIKTVTEQYSDYKSNKKKMAQILLLAGLSFPVLTYALGRATGHPHLAASVAILFTGAYGAFIASRFTREFHSFNFERVSSLHNAEQARVDSFPATQDAAIFTSPGPLFGLQLMVDTQQYLQAKNAECARPMPQGTLPTLPTDEL